MNQIINKTATAKAQQGSLIVIMLSLFMIMNATAATKTFTGSGNFGDAARWGGLLPVTGDSLIIQGTCTVENNANTDTSTFGNLRIGSTAAATLNWAASGTNRLKVMKIYSLFAGSALNMTNGGSLFVSGDWDLANLTYTPGTTTITFNGSGTQTIRGTAAGQTFYNFVVAKPASTVLNFGSNPIALTVTNNFTLTSGDFTAPSSNILIGVAAGTSSMVLTSGTYTAGTSMSVRGNVTVSSAATFVAGTGTTFIINGGPGTDSFNGTATTLNFYNLTINKSPGNTMNTGGNIRRINVANNYLTSTGSFVLPDSFIVGGNMTMNTNTLTAGSVIHVGGSWQLSSAGTFVPGTGVVIFNGPARQNITGTSAAQTFNNIILAKTTDTSFVNVTGLTVTLAVKDFTINTGNVILPATLNVSGNCSKAGGTTITVGSGLISFYGTSLQNTNFPSYYNIDIANTAGVALTANASVANYLTFTAGNLSLGTNNLTIQNTGTISSASASAYIVTNNNPITGGFLIQRVIGANALFPVGTSTSYTPVTLNNSGTADDFRVRVFNGVFSAGTIGSQLPRGVNRTWLIEQVGAVSASITMTLQWNQGEHIGSFDSSSCGVFHYTNGNWDEPSSYAIAGGSDPYTVSRTGITDFSPFGVGDGIVPLPVELLSFSAKSVNNAVKLSWVTATEINNSHFEIQRSADGNNFSSIGRVEGAGNSNSIISYKHSDKNPVQGQISYYRLKQVDFDGSSSYSAVEVIEAEASTIKLGKVYPMPAGETFNITLHNTISGNVTVEIYDLSGRMISAGTFSLSAGQHTLNIGTADLAQGTYLLGIRNEAESHIIKLLK